MPTRIYTGPHAGTEIPLPDGTTLTVLRGESADVSKEMAASLDEQGDSWSTTKETLKDLRAKAKSLGLQVPTGAKKADVEALISNAVTAEPTGDADDPDQTADGEKE